MSLACLPRHPAVANLGLVGVELYFEDLPRARAFYQEVLGLELAETQEGHHVKFMTPGGFICLERQGVEEYPSADKAVLFFEVTLSAPLRRPNQSRIRGASQPINHAVIRVYDESGNVIETHEHKDHFRECS